MTLDYAVQLHHAGRHAEAESAYRLILQQRPDDPDALLLSALLDYELGRTETPPQHDHIHPCTNPNIAILLNNAAEKFRNGGKPERAVPLYQLAIVFNDQIAEIHENLGATLLLTNRAEQAIESLETALRLKPALASAYCVLGSALRERQRYGESINSYRSALALNPRLVDALSGIGLTYLASGQETEAATYLRTAVDIDPTHLRARHYLSCLGGLDTMARADPGFMVFMFDKFAATFDSHLVDKLGYRAPWQLQETLSGIIKPVENSLDILDMGCGTGLCGPLLRPWARRLVGVDIAPRMIEEARKREIYDELVVDDIVHCLDRSPTSYDLLVAADVFIYLGDISDVFASARAALRPGGMLAFTTERLDNGTGYRISTNTRFAHAQAYILTLASEHGYDIMTTLDVEIRKEMGTPVMGQIFILRTRNTTHS
jgi:predicted TPR repeat methyltransferase